MGRVSGDQPTRADPTRPGIRHSSGVIEASPSASPGFVRATVAPTPVRAVATKGADRAAAAPARIVVPSLRLDAPVVPVSRVETSAGGRTQAVYDVPDEYAAGWHDTSALLGEPGNTVLNGHNTGHGEVFRDLHRLQPGDEVILYADQVSYTYHVSQTLILPEGGQPLEVRLENARYVVPTLDTRLTLVTCHPYGSLRNRLIVIARLDGD